MGMYATLVRVSADDLEAMRDDPDRAAEAVDGTGYSLEKMWQALHILLTGDPIGGGDPPLAWAVFGAEDIGEDLGYGPIRCLGPDRVREVSAALTSLSRDELRSRFVPAQFEAAGIYPGVWDEDEEELFDELMMYFDGLSESYRQAAAHGDGMLMAIR